MKTVHVLRTVAAICLAIPLCASVGEAAPFGTVFKYQGRLMDANYPADGIYEFEFRLYDVVEDGNQLDGTAAFRGVGVVDGYFTVNLDFGSGVFTGDARWLEIGIRPSGTTGPFTTLSPRQELTPAPYAIYSSKSGPDNDWQVSGSDMFSIPSGNVGIGTTDPGSRLTIKASDTFSTGGVKLISSINNNNIIYMQDTSPGDQGQIAVRAGGSDKVVLRANGNTYFHGGNVGIGTAGPVTKLHIVGGTDASLTTHGFLVAGPTSGVNIVLDDNEIIARNNGAASKLYLNKDSGNVVVEVLEITGGSDLAEPFEVAGAESVETGMVVAIDPEHPGQLRIADKAYDRKVAGVISGAGGIKPGMLMGQRDSIANGTNPVALTGRVYCLADAAYGTIQPGDLLTTSQTPGHAMKVTDYSRAHGATLGKAMSPLDHGRGLVLVLVSLQ